MNLRPWQQEAYPLFKEHKKLLCEVNVGAGKTFFAVYCVKDILKQHPKVNVLVVTPTIVLMKKNWLAEFRNFGFNEELGVYYGQKKQYKQITVTTVASFPKIDHSKFNFLIYDEIHHCTSADQLNGILKPWPYMIGLSATLPKGLNFNDIIRNRFNKIYALGVSEALNQNIMNEFELKDIEITITDDKFKKKYEAIDKKLKEHTDNNGGFFAIMKLNKFDKVKKLYFKYLSIRKKIVLANKKKHKIATKIISRNKDKKIIVFSETVESLKILQKYLSEQNISSEICESKMKKSEINNVLDRYERDEFNVLLTARMFDEGYNLPKIDMAVIFFGNSTPKQFKQRVGRSTRAKGTTSFIYQLYIKDTFEERYVSTRTREFKKKAKVYRKIQI